MEVKNIEESDSLPEDFKKELISFKQQFVVKTEKSLERLRKKKQ